MKAGVGKMKQMISSGMRRAKDFFMRRRYVSGVTVIEMVLILVRIFTPYYGVGIRCMA